MTPVPMMDRDKAFVPKQQIGFLSNIALPVYKYVHTQIEMHKKLACTIAQM